MIVFRYTIWVCFFPLGILGDFRAELDPDDKEDRELFMDPSSSTSSSDEP